ncbi:MAG: hypothetical protein ACRD50_00405 [Candidatus Acidiferrales bacterium]
MALFIALIVAVVVTQICFDMRESQRQWALPSWARGIAVAGILGAFITVVASMTSAAIQGAGRGPSVLGAVFFWPQLTFMLLGLGLVVLAVLKKRLRFFLILAALLVVAFWVGFAFAS